MVPGMDEFRIYTNQLVSPFGRLQQRNWERPSITSSNCAPGTVQVRHSAHDLMQDFGHPVFSKSTLVLNPQSEAARSSLGPKKCVENNQR